MKLKKCCFNVDAPASTLIIAAMIKKPSNTNYVINNKEK